MECETPQWQVTESVVLIGLMNCLSFVDRVQRRLLGLKKIGGAFFSTKAAVMSIIGCWALNISITTTIISISCKLLIEHQHLVPSVLLGWGRAFSTFKPGLQDAIRRQDRSEYLPGIKEHDHLLHSFQSFWVSTRDQRAWSPSSFLSNILSIYQGSKSMITFFIPSNHSEHLPRIKEHDHIHHSSQTFWAFTRDQRAWSRSSFLPIILSIYQGSKSMITFFIPPNHCEHLPGIKEHDHILHSFQSFWASTRDQRAWSHSSFLPIILSIYQGSKSMITFFIPPNHCEHLPGIKEHDHVLHSSQSFWASTRDQRAWSRSSFLPIILSIYQGSKSMITFFIPLTITWICYCSIIYRARNSLKTVSCYCVQSNRLCAGKQSRYVTSHLGQFSLPSRRDN